MQNIIDRIKAFTTALQTDPNRNKKILLTTGWIVLLVIIVVAVFILSRPVSNSNNNPNVTNADPQTISDILGGSDFVSKFPTGPDLVKVSNVQVANGRSFLIDRDGIPVYLGEDEQIHIGDKKTNEPEVSSLPVSIYQSELSYFVNENVRGSQVITSLDDVKVIQNPENIPQVVPFRESGDLNNGEQYFFVENTTTGYVLKKSDAIQLIDPKEIGKISSDTTIYPYFQMFKLNNSILIAFFESSSQQGKVDFWQYKDGKLNQLFSMRNVWSVNAALNYLLITYSTPVSSLVSAYQNEIYDLSGNPIKMTISPSFLVRQKELYGNLIARRCTFGVNLMYCLVKERARQTDDTNESDLILKFDFQGNSVEVINNGSIPPMRSIFLQGNNLYFVALRDGFMYKLQL